MNMVIGTLLAIVISGAAYRLRALSSDGAIAATFLGALAFGLGGWPWAIVLLTFFITSSILSATLKGANKDVSRILELSGLATVAESVGMQVIYYDVETKLALGNARPVSRLREQCAHADRCRAGGGGRPGINGDFPLERAPMVEDDLLAGLIVQACAQPEEDSNRRTQEYAPHLQLSHIFACCLYVVLFILYIFDVLA